MQSMYWNIQLPHDANHNFTTIKQTICNVKYFVRARQKNIDKITIKKYYVSGVNIPRPCKKIKSTFLRHLFLFIFRPRPVPNYEPEICVCVCIASCSVCRIFYTIYHYTTANYRIFPRLLTAKVCRYSTVCNVVPCISIIR